MKERKSTKHVNGKDERKLTAGMETLVIRNVRKSTRANASCALSIRLSLQKVIVCWQHRVQIFVCNKEAILTDRITLLNRDQRRSAVRNLSESIEERGVFRGMICVSRYTYRVTISVLRSVIR